jgi:hypothetical protein
MHITGATELIPSCALIGLCGHGAPGVGSDGLHCEEFVFNVANTMSTSSSDAVRSQEK